MFRRLLASLLLLVVAAALLIVTWPQLFGLQRTMWIAQLVSLRGLAVVVAAVLIIIFLLLAAVGRPFRRLGASLALLLLVFALANGAVLASRGFGNGAFNEKGPSDLTVMSWNTLGGAPGADSIAKLAVDSDADIVSLPETTNQTAESVATMMKAEGHPMEVHTIAFDQISRSRSTSVLISTALGSYHVDKEDGSTSRLPTIIAEPDDGTGPTIIAVHAVSPTEFTSWKSDLSWLSGVCDSDNVIMAGDFNATLDHLSGLDKMTDHALGNCTDAALQTGNAALGTWPTSIPALLGAPIDHVMATDGWKVTGMRVVQDHDGAGSDHRPIVVQLSPKR